MIDLLSLDVAGCVVASPSAALIAIGGAAGELAGRLCHPEAGLAGVDSPARVFFGLPILTAPEPLLVGCLMTEHNARLDQLSLFGWIEDNGILEPRAEVLGMTPLGEQPVTFLRDIDLDRPPEAWMRGGRPERWLRVVGIAVAEPGAAAGVERLAGDQAALAALAHVLPAVAQPFLDGLKSDVARGLSLRAALRPRRKTAGADLLRSSDGWRVLARAARIIRLCTAAPVEAVTAVIPFHLPRRW